MFLVWLEGSVRPVLFFGKPRNLDSTFIVAIIGTGGAKWVKCHNASEKRARAMESREMETNVLELLMKWASVRARKKSFISTTDGKNMNIERMFEQRNFFSFYMLAVVFKRILKKNEKKTTTSQSVAAEMTWSDWLFQTNQRETFETDGKKGNEPSCAWQDASLCVCSRVVWLTWSLFNIFTLIISVNNHEASSERAGIAVVFLSSYRQSILDVNSGAEVLFFDLTTSTLVKDLQRFQ